MYIDFSKFKFYLILFNIIIINIICIKNWIKMDFTMGSRFLETGTRRNGNPDTPSEEGSKFLPLYTSTLLLDRVSPN